MPNDRNDNDIPNIVLEKEDREAFQRSRAKETGKVDKKGKTEQVAETNNGGGSPVWLVLTLIIAIGAAGMSYWLFQQKLIQDAALADAQSRVSELERRLSATGEEMDQSAGALRVTVSELSDKTDELWDQMDKLWASAWRKNQAEIKDVSENMARNNRSLKNSVSGVESEMSNVSTSVALLQEQLTTQAREVADVQILIAALQGIGNDNKRGLGDIQAKLVSIEQVNSAVTRRVAELEKWRRDRPAAGTSSPGVP